MDYCSTRDSDKRVSAAEAILTGLSPDGGLFVPTSFPKLDMEALRNHSYTEIAFSVLSAFLPDFDAGFLHAAIDQSYGKNFGDKAGHLHKLNDSLYSLELWHGPTAAFKDYALQLMPRLLAEARRMLGVKEEIHILVATSGDTGKAALDGFQDLDGTGITVFYPNQGTSEIQRLQMVTQEGSNVAVYAVKGNFDDAQRGVKATFGDEALRQKLQERGIRLSSANSINWGRLVPQVVYYVSSYLALCARGAITMGDALDFCVPTGNFGDIMAGWYAKQMGLPVGRLLCASNKNNVLSEFLETGRYNAKRDFFKTSSPSMDILVSSNLERLLFHTAGAASTKSWMEQLALDGAYGVDGETLENIRGVFSGGWTPEEEVGEEIRRIRDTYGYLCDPHTAVAFRVLGAPQRPSVVLSTASPFKFSGKVLEALGQPVPQDEFEALRALEAVSGEKAPLSLSGLRGKPIRFTEVITPAGIPATTLR